MNKEITAETLAALRTKFGDSVGGGDLFKFDPKAYYIANAGGLPKIKRGVYDLTGGKAVAKMLPSLKDLVPELDGGLLDVFQGNLATKVITETAPLIKSGSVVPPPKYVKGSAAVTTTSEIAVSRMIKVDGKNYERFRLPAYWEGYDAKAEDCPYPPTSGKGCDWNAGFYAAKYDKRHD